MPRGSLRLSSNADPFRVAWAADNELKTAWTTRFPSQAGTRFEVDLGRELEVGEVRYTIGYGEAHVQPLVLLSSDAREWRQARARVDFSLLPPKNWRPEVGRWLKSQGLDYLLIVNLPDISFAPLFQDLLTRQEEWGIREVFRWKEASVLQLPPATGEPDTGTAADHR